MQESVTYQAIKSEGRAEGSREALREVAVNLLKEGMEVAVVSRVTGLSVEQVQQLAE
ncbi:MAG: hypothetical protein HC879_13445 [Leptolyngbyaceae cyanobacterium SL_5_9]|nr:hypothetical protein [Leptolyngbyaceae cyanobacterium SL_5_9]NJO74303.1 hypothetical protein [Leptolyngbyaceae cyanobacterium RM1_406_9]